MKGGSAMWRAKSAWGERLTDLAFFLAGSLLYGVSVNMFTAPNHIAPGGLTGLSTLVNYLFGTPIGTVIFLMNIPLFVWAVSSVGYKLVVKTVAATLLSSAAIDLMSLVIRPISATKSSRRCSAGWRRASRSRSSSCAAARRAAPT